MFFVFVMMVLGLHVNVGDFDGGRSINHDLGSLLLLTLLGLSASSCLVLGLLGCLLLGSDRGVLGGFSSLGFLFGLVIFVGLKPFGVVMLWKVSNVVLVSHVGMISGDGLFSGSLEVGGILLDLVMDGLNLIADFFLLFLLSLVLLHSVLEVVLVSNINCGLFFSFFGLDSFVDGGALLFFELLLGLLDFLWLGSFLSVL